MSETQVKTEIKAYGIKVLLAAHPEVRRLKRQHTPTWHGNKFWTSSWLIMDFLRGEGMPSGTRVLDAGCGWGLTGIWCARAFDAEVTGADIDEEVFPYLDLHAAVNKVEVATMETDFDGIRTAALKKFDLIVGADICFWDEMVDPLKRLIKRALNANVRMVIIADPGRAPFEQLAGYFINNGEGKWTAEALDRKVDKPRRIRGRLLVIRKRG